MDEIQIFSSKRLLKFNFYLKFAQKNLFLFVSKEQKYQKTFFFTIKSYFSNIDTFAEKNGKVSVSQRRRKQKQRRTSHLRIDVSLCLSISSFTGELSLSVTYLHFRYTNVHMGYSLFVHHIWRITSTYIYLITNLTWYLL